jgi:hypothetical protein
MSIKGINTLQPSQSIPEVIKSKMADGRAYRVIEREERRIESFSKRTSNKTTRQT